MNIKLMQPKNLGLSLMILASVGLSASFLQPIFTTRNRWILLGVLSAFLLGKKFSFRWLKSGFGLLLITYVCWCMLTFSWSSSPSLSLMKSVALLFVAVAMTSAGYAWVNEHSLETIFSYLAPLAIVSFLAGVLGKWSENSIVQSGDTVMYQGLIGGPNMFGMMFAMTSPFLLWQLYIHSRQAKKRMFWLLAVAFCILFLGLSNSRASILVFLLVGAGFVAGIDLNKKILLLFCAITVVSLTALLRPLVIESAEKKFIYKYATEEQGVFFTRQRVWEDSYAFALQGGVIGGGYGVTIGQPVFEGGLTAVGYGREKGNSQLAVMEETGLIGLFLYVLVLTALFHKILTAFSRERDKPRKIILGITVGTIVGMLVNSLFEAWWVAPGAPESFYFWALVGIGLGLSNQQAYRLPGQRPLWNASNIPSRFHGHRL